MRPPDGGGAWRSLTIRTALLLGFGVTVGIWVFAGYYFTARIADLESRVVAVSNRYLSAQELLANARGQVLAASVLIRDALLDPSPVWTRDYPGELSTAYKLADQALDRYVPVLDAPDERARLARLQRELRDLGQATLQVLADRRPTTDAGLLLRSRIMPKREAAIAVADELQALNRAAFVQHQLEMGAINRQTQRHVWQTLGLALAASLAVGVLAISHAVRLEQRLRLQSAVDHQNRRDLQRLSARLVTAQEDERRTIARELHDEVGQVLTAIKVELAVVQRAVDAGSVSPGMLDDARSITERALNTVRDLSNLLHPPLLDDLGLPEALEAYLREFRKRHDLKVEFVHDPAIDSVSRRTDVAAYRIVQEALTNVVRHAQASGCRVALRLANGAVLLTIEDDGVGFDPSEVDQPGARRGLGLLGMQERVAQMGGTFSVESVIGKGTRILVRLPAPGMKGSDLDLWKARVDAPGVPQIGL
jgi:signal transduction histidine kinase